VEERREKDARPIFQKVLKMDRQRIHAVTGAFGYSGKYIAKRLLKKGRKVITLTNSLNRKNPFGVSVRAFPFNFDNPDWLCQTLSEVDVLYNTYWVRFNHKRFTFAEALRNTITMFDAAKKAGVKRIIHVSITNPSEDSQLEYFSCKANLERILIETGISYAILRPTVLFGKEDILINNISWAIRHLPFFGVFGDGQYRLQPIYVDDLAELAVQYGNSQENVIIDCIGPETFTFKELVQDLSRIIGVNRKIISIPPNLGYFAALILGKLVNDVIITRDEIEGLMKNLLYVDSPPVGKTKLTEWASQNAEMLGRRYTSELSRRRDRENEYTRN